MQTIQYVHHIKKIVQKKYIQINEMMILRFFNHLQHHDHMVCVVRKTEVLFKGYLLKRKKETK